MMRTVRRSTAGILLACALALLSVGAARADYVLRSGDAIRFFVAGLPELSREAEIGLDGLVRLPQIGAFEAAGRTLQEFEEAIGQRVQGRPFKRFDAGGVPVFLTLSAEDVAVDMAAYRPVYVAGDVARPGAVPFQPGLTVRAAIAVGGGARIGGPVAELPDPDREARLRGEFNLRALELAHLQADLWRLGAELAEDRDAPSPDASAAIFGEETFAEVIALHRQRLQASLEQLDEDRAYLQAASEQAESRIDILREQSENQQAAVEADDQEMERVRQLFDRGIVPMDRMLDIRRAQLASATRLLQSEEGLARANLDQTRLRHDKDILEEERKARIFAQIDETERSIRSAETRLSTVREQLQVVGAAPVGLAIEPADPIVTLHRDDANEVTAMKVPLDHKLLPGDVVEVRVPPFGTQPLGQ
jgi:polysaccharide biosynthesis/export protein